jgi:hypothetical protein
MAKIGKAPCPVCGQEFVDPDFSSNRARSAVLTCPNCKSGLQWVKPVWDRFHFPLFFVATLPEWMRLVADAPRHDSPLHRFYLICAVLAFLIGGVALLGTLLERMGVLPLKLKVTAAPYASPSPNPERLKEWRGQFAKLPRLQINPRSTPPSFLRGKSILFQSDSPSAGPESRA